jgi:hypothetical protein
MGASPPHRVCPRFRERQNGGCICGFRPLKKIFAGLATGCRRAFADRQNAAGQTRNARFPFIFDSHGEFGTPLAVGVMQSCMKGT